VVIASVLSLFRLRTDGQIVARRQTEYVGTARLARGYLKVSVATDESEGFTASDVGVRTFER